MDTHNPLGPIGNCGLVELSRRHFLSTAAGTAAVALLPRRAPAATVSGGKLVALHIHSSLSEGNASVAAQLAAAARLGVDVIWFTEHDWRMAFVNYITGHPLTAPAAGDALVSRESGSGGSISAAGLDPGGAIWRLTAANLLARGNAANLTISVDAIPAAGGLVLIAVGSRRTFGGEMPAASRRITSAGRIEWRPAAALPGGADNALTALRFGGHGRLRNLRLHWGPPTGLGLQRRLVAAAGSRVPAHLGLELSYLPEEHIGAYGAAQMPHSFGDRYSYPALVAAAKSRGAFTTYNHPFGSEPGGGGVSPARISAVAQLMLRRDAYGCRGLEVGYDARGGATLRNHLDLLDVLHRNGLPLVGVGASDDHNAAAQHWTTGPNNFGSMVGAATVGEMDLAAAMRAGRVTVRRLTTSATVELSAEDTPMGSASVCRLPERRLTVAAGNLPRGARIVLFRGSHTRGLVPDTRPVAVLPGSATVRVDTTEPGFYRAELIWR